MGARGRGLSFELQGEGNLPQLAVIKPSLRNTRGHPLLLFRRLLLHQSQRLGVTLRNTGTMLATVHVETVSGRSVFYRYSTPRTSGHPTGGCKGRG